MKLKKHKNKSNDKTINTVVAGKKTYSEPKILSVERLEAAAATCDPPAGAFGKVQPFPCTKLGS